jgi:agarase
MDFWSIHLYDFPEFIGDPFFQQQYRKGSNMEATFDMLDHYSLLALGEIKPYVISEYGAQVHASLDQPWTPLRDWKILKSVNAMLMAFLERPDRIALSVPFIVMKAEWGRRQPNVPYAHRLMRQAFEAQGETGEKWVYTDLVKFYQLWSDVKGQRVDSRASDLDVRVDAYRDGRDLYLLATNLDFEPVSLEFHLLGLDRKKNRVTSVSAKHLHRAGDAATLDTLSWPKLPPSFELGAEATAIFHVRLANEVRRRHKSGERIHFARQYKQPISGNQTLSFEVPDVVPGLHGEAVLRLGVGRDHGLSLQPQVLLNGAPAPVPADIRGDDQLLGGSGRPSFFGVLEIPLPYDALQRDNRIDITFPDTGGHVSSLAIQSFRFSRDPDRH